MSGHRNFNELLAKMSPERRARVKAEADDLHREYELSQIPQYANQYLVTHYPTIIYP